ncbi:hypothetical protein [Nonomuraea insulae]|uniref:Uncharacterized protein n=1 Tax=Nonomuraea insulae TaxID=1616787 RepID=A0ABW1D3U7_9ACTN
MPCQGGLPGTVITTACFGALWRWLLRGPRLAATSPEQPLAGTSAQAAARAIVPGRASESFLL